MGAKLSLQQEALPATLMLNEPQSAAVLWSQQVNNRWNTSFDELSNQHQNFSISSLSVIIICYCLFTAIKII